MDWSAAHLHLLTNHVPIIGTLLTILVLGWGLFRHSREVTTVGLVLSVLIGIGGLVARQTGHEAEEQIEDLSWSNRRLVHEHEEAADLAFWVIASTGVIGLGALAMRRGGRSGPTWLPWLTFGGLVVSMVLVSRAALLGGYIRHDEVRPAGIDLSAPPGRDADAD